jgi:hypothetical protein
MDTPTAIAIIGGVALLIAIIGGGIEVKEIVIPRIPNALRLLSFLLGLVCIGIAIILYSKPAWMNPTNWTVSAVPTMPSPSVPPNSVTPIPTAVIPTPTQSCVSPTYFESVWRTHPQLGCPTNSLTSDFTFQYYQKGIMTWQKSPSPSTIYAFFNDGGWERQTNPGGPETPPCPEAQMIGRPIRGFGTLWCNNQNWRERLGVPTSDENDGKNNQIQIFQNGTIFTVGAAGGFVLYSNSRWEKF